MQKHKERGLFFNYLHYFDVHFVNLCSENHRKNKISKYICDGKKFFFLFLKAPTLGRLRNLDLKQLPKRLAVYPSV